ncbi:phage gp36-like protein [Rhodobium orientis]|uniref:DUF1320 domain-containing protein n=2 Tax=Rhodobium orientis TaxID=34017 RepID=A0A327JL63_9HYPH|nr:DUF1320 domain-containing protein [Rhodobium orientis]MBB4302349.1 phage gp36-like protein [Rhodobium orientis]MBK5949054.1 hypothetical protein [Rhodobium orientis]RAI26635.1 hypothetical protein CH339_13540 [Rhodobium orientis]
MIYASKADIEALYGPDFLTDILPGEMTEPADIDAAVANALSAASEEIDEYLSARYRLPLKSAPSNLRRPAIDIAVYVLANRHSSLTEDIRQRYEDATARLKRIADGKSGLGTSEPRIDGGGSTTATGSGADFTAEPRRFTRDTMR